MRAAWYEQQGSAQAVIHVGEMPDPTPSAGEVRIRVAVSGINPGDTKKRQNAFGYGMPYPRVIPHSDGAGVIDAVGAGVPATRIGQPVWCYGAQTYRPFGTAAEYTVVPTAQAVPLPDGIPLEQGACLGIPGITAYQAVHGLGPVAGRIVLVHGGAGAVGRCAVQLASRAGAMVIATVRSAEDIPSAQQAGAAAVILTGPNLVAHVHTEAPSGVDHIIDVAFGSTIAANEALLTNGGSIATYATDSIHPTIPYWPLLFKNTRILFVGSDDLPPPVKTAAAQALNDALAAGWTGWPIAERLPLNAIAQAHDLVDHPGRRGRVVLLL